MSLKIQGDQNSSIVQDSLSTGSSGSVDTVAGKEQQSSLVMEEQNLLKNLGKENDQDNVSRPVLDPPCSDDIGSITLAVESIRDKLLDMQIQSGKISLASKTKRKEQQTQEIIKKLEEAQKKMDKAKAWGLFGKIAGLVVSGIVSVVGVVIGAAITIGTLGTGTPAAIALSAAIIGVSIGLAATMFALQASGALDKLTDLIAKGLQKAGIKNELAAQILASVLVTGAVILVDIVNTICSLGLTAALKAAVAVAEETGKSILEALVIVIKQAAKEFVKKIIAGVEKAASLLTKEGIKAATEGAWETAKASFSKAFDEIKEAVLKTLKGMVDGSILKAVKQALNEAKETVLESIKAAFEKFCQGIAKLDPKNMLEGLEQKASALAKASTEDIIKAVKDALKSVLSPMRLLLKNPKALKMFNDAIANTGQVVQSSADIKAAYEQKGAADAQADAKDIKALIEKITQEQQEIIDVLEDCVQSIQTGMENVSNILNAEATSQTHIANAMQGHQRV